MKILTAVAKSTTPVLFLLLALTSIESTAAAQDKKGALQIKSMQAKLFMMRDGTFGEDLIGSGQASIVWNVGVNYTADTFLVIVEVTGPPENREPLPTLVFTAATGRRVFLNQTARIFNTIGDGTYYAAFLVPTTGCDPIKVTARIQGQRKAATMSKLINFQCGE